MCAQCTKTRQFSDLEFFDSDSIQVVVLELAARIASDEPVRCCDDPERWNWREYLAERLTTKQGIAG